MGVTHGQGCDSVSVTDGPGCDSISVTDVPGCDSISVTDGGPGCDYGCYRWPRM